MWVNSDLQQFIINAMIESKGDSNKLDDLLANIKCNINAYDVEGCAYIHWAARLGYTSCIEVLMKYGADITLPTFEEKTVYDIACQYGNTETAEWVRFTMDEVEEFFNSIMENDTTRLRKCIGNKKCVFFKNRHGMGGLHVACHNATHDCISFLVENGFDVNEQDNFGRTPLHWACINQDLPLIDYLIQNRADVTICSLTKKTPVHLCFAFSSEINNPVIEQHYPAAFFDAVQRYDRESLRAFFQHTTNEAAASLRNEQGCSALHIAVRTGRSELVCELLERGFDKYLKDYNNETPYDLGRASNERIRELLGIEEEVETEYHLNEGSQVSSFSSVIEEDWSFKPTEKLPPLPVLEVEEAVAEPPISPIPLPPLTIPKESVPIVPSPTPPALSVVTSPVSAMEGRPSIVESVELEKNSSMELAEETDLTDCKTVEDLLNRLGFQEYTESFAKLNCVMVDDLYRVSEKQMKDFMKFGHRIKLCEVLRQLDPLFSFLSSLGWLDRYEQFEQLAFMSIWSILAITRDCRETLGLADEEMEELVKARDAFEESKKTELINCPTLMDLKEESDSKPILLMLFSEETTDRLIHDCALENVSFLKVVTLDNVDELGLKYGEALGLCYLVSFIKSKTM